MSTNVQQHASGSFPRSTFITFIGALEALHAFLGIAVFSATISLVRTALSTSTWVLLMLSAKPLVDLTWRVEFLFVLGQRINPQTVLALVAISLTFVAAVAGRGVVVRDGWVLALQGWAVLSALASLTSGSMNELIRLSCGLCLFFVVGNAFQTRADFERFLRAFLLCMSVPVVLGLGQAAGVLPYEYWDWINGVSVGRVSGTYQHPLGLVYLLLFGFPFALHLLYNTRISISIRSVLVVGIAASAVALACTYHRTGLIAVGFEVVLWYVLTGKVRASNLKHLAYTVPFLLLAAPVAVAWISMLFNRSVASGGGADEFLRGRGLNWLLFLGTLFHSQPLYWFLGKGSSLAEAFVPGYGMYYSDEPHNDVIRMLYIYGIVGLCIYATILYRFFRQSLVLRRGADPFGRSLGNLSLAILPSFLLMSMTGEPLRYPTGAWYLFAMASIVRVQSQKVSFAASGPQC